MNPLQFRPLFRTEYLRIRSQMLPLLDALAAAPQAKEGLDAIRKRWLALKSAAGVVQLAWLERLCELVEQRLTQAAQDVRALAAADVAVLHDALLLAVPLADGTDEHWATASEAAASRSASLLVLLKGAAGGKGTPGVVPPMSGKPIAAATVPGAAKPAAKPASPVQAKMLALYRNEVQEHTEAIQRGLLKLEAAPDQAASALMPVMRSVHAIKGASSAVRQALPVRLAHAFEDRLQAIQRGQKQLRSHDIELFLQVNDQLLALATVDADASAAATVQSMVDTLSADDEGAYEQNYIAIKSIAQKPIPEITSTNLIAENLAAQVQLPDVSAPAPAPPPAAAPQTPAPAQNLSTIAAAEALAARGDTTLRVNAEPINRLLGMAAQQVVDNAILRTFLAELRQLRLDTKAITDQLEELHQVLGAPPASDPVGAHFSALRNRVRANRQRLSAHTETFNTYAGQLEHTANRMYRTTSQVRLRPIADILLGFPRMARDLAKRLEKRIKLSISGEELTADRDVLERLEAPLTQLLRNAIDHGIEPPPVRDAAGKPEQADLRIKVRPHAGMLLIEVSDDGGGINLEKIRTSLVKNGMPQQQAAMLERADLLEVLFKSGFSTASEVTEVSGRGVGLDIVRTNLHEIGGSIRITSNLGAGTTFHLLVPLSRSVVRTVVVEAAGDRYGFPLARIGRLLRLPVADLPAGHNWQYAHVAGANLRLMSLSRLLELGDVEITSEYLNAVVIDNHNRPFGFVADRVVGEFDLSVRPIDPRLGRVSDLSAAAVMPDGTPVLLIDVDDLLRNAERTLDMSSFAREADADAGRRKRILVADDSISVRELVRQLLVTRGYHVEVAVDGSDAWRKVRDEPFDMLITDVDMPRMDGIQLTRSIKQDANLRKLPVMIVSYRDKPEDRARGLEARADCYVTKSDFHDARFIELVQDLLGAATE